MIKKRRLRMKPKMLRFAILVYSLATSAVGAQGEKMSSSLVDAIKLSKEAKSVTPVFSDRFKVLGIGLSTGQKLEKHETPEPAFLLVHSGKILFSMEGKSHTLQSGEFFSIPAKKIHEVEALQDSRLLLIK